MDHQFFNSNGPHNKQYGLIGGCQTRSDDSMEYEGEVLSTGARFESGAKLANK